MSAQVIRGHDYEHGVDVQLTPGQWRALCDLSAYTRRVGSSVLGFTHDLNKGHALLWFEIYDDTGALKLSRSAR